MPKQSHHGILGSFLVSPVAVASVDNTVADFYLHLQDVGNGVTLGTMLSPYIFILFWEFLGNDLEPNQVSSFFYSILEVSFYSECL
jgi:hypothetical protein